MELIDRNELREIWGMADRCENCKQDAGECNYHQYFTRMDFCGWLDDAEVIDAVPVVRCKDCKCAKPEKGYFVCDYQSAAVLPDWYCWNGERKDNVLCDNAGGDGD